MTNNPTPKFDTLSKGIKRAKYELERDRARASLAEMDFQLFLLDKKEEPATGDRIPDDDDYKAVTKNVRKTTDILKEWPPELVVFLDLLLLP